MKAIFRAPWHSLLSTGLLLVLLGIGEFLYQWFGQHLSLAGLLDWLRAIIDHLLG